MRRLGSRGQASILVAIIFQVIFIFFAMVINVGLLIHDKINLQNSADIAAYYGAMKQAEVMNAMAHINYQIRQAYKLMNWRYWGLAAAGMNDGYVHGSIVNTEQSEPGWTWSADGRPIVCVGHRMWKESYRKNSKPDNLCHKPQYPKINPMPLLHFQNMFAFMAVFAAQSEANAHIFNEDFKNTGPDNYVLAIKILATYKMAVANRRAAMQKLEKLLVTQNDFTDLQGQSVKDFSELTFRKNLTLANKTADFTFINGVAGKPFLVPREVRVYMLYLDYSTSDPNNNSALIKNVAEPPSDTSNIKEIVSIAPSIFGWDYGFDQAAPTTAADFLSEPNPAIDLKSLVLFEKNPWVQAYVGVVTTSKPTMLFAPFLNPGGVTLKAESWAMPFGGRIGPWMNNQWPHGQEYSSGEKVDKLLPKGMEESFADYTEVPNFSRFPGDANGMKSPAAHNMGLEIMVGLDNGGQPVSYSNDYDLNVVPSQLWRDMLSPRQEVRRAEIMAMSPDLFDASYYSIDPWFTHTDEKHRNLRALERRFLLTNICGLGCSDFGSVANRDGVSEPMAVSDQVKIFGALQAPSWKLDKLEQLNTSWAQESSHDYLYHGPSMIGAPAVDGGRSGYSVKIVNRNFLASPQPLGGGFSGSDGVITNAPNPF